MIQQEFIINLLKNNPKAKIFGSLGTISYDLDEFTKDWNEIEKTRIQCVRGNMGGVLGISLGYALSLPDKETICLIGDGAFLMKMGSMATILKYNPKNLKIYILNNGQHKSSGGQKTNFEEIKDYLPTYFKIINVE